MLRMVFEATMYSHGNSTYVSPETKQAKRPLSIWRHFLDFLLDYIIPQMSAAEERHNNSKVL